MRRVVFGAWLKYGKQGEDIIAEILASCVRNLLEYSRTWCWTQVLEEVAEYQEPEDWSTLESTEQLSRDHGVTVNKLKMELTSI
ncbi:unnamed protein product [Rhodiola kirilowii]